MKCNARTWRPHTNTRENVPTKPSLKITKKFVDFLFFKKCQCPIPRSSSPIDQGESWRECQSSSRHQFATESSWQPLSGGRSTGGPIGARKTSCARDRVSLMRIASDFAALPLPLRSQHQVHNSREQIVAALEVFLVLPVFIFLSIRLARRLVGRVLGRKRARHCYIDG